MAAQVIQKATKAPRHHHHLHYHSEALKAACCRSVSAVVHSSVDGFHSEPCPKHQQVDDIDNDDTNTHVLRTMFVTITAIVLVHVVHLTNVEQYCEQGCKFSGNLIFPKIFRKFTQILVKV